MDCPRTRLAATNRRGRSVGAQQLRLLPRELVVREEVLGVELAQLPQLLHLVGGQPAGRLWLACRFRSALFG